MLPRTEAQNHIQFNLNNVVDIKVVISNLEKSSHTTPRLHNAVTTLVSLTTIIVAITQKEIGM